MSAIHYRWVASLTGQQAAELQLLPIRGGPGFFSREAYLTRLAGLAKIISLQTPSLPGRDSPCGPTRT